MTFDALRLATPGVSGLSPYQPGKPTLLGAPADQVRRVLQALLFAFGPPRSRASQITAVASLAEQLWESLPARAQRELRELCADPAKLDYDAALAVARRAARRAGLFVSGDLEVAVRASCAELGISSQILGAPDGLAAACSSSPCVSDLVRLATNPQYAETRWRPSRAGRRPPSGSYQAV